MRDPDVIIGGNESPYLFRWFLIPRNRFCNIYLHKFLRSDDDRAFHDHPWWSLSFLLKGRYLNVTPAGRRLRRRFSLMWMRATDSHRVELIDETPVWTLFFTGPKVREWGFHCPQGFVHWRKFTTPNGNAVGKGCDE